MDVEQLEAISFNEMSERLPQVVSADGGLDPKSDRVRWIVWRVELPALQHELTGNRKIVVNKALNLLARHNLPPPDWLAAEMLVRFPTTERINSVGTDKILAIFNAVAKTDKSDAALDLIAEEHNMSLTKLKRLLKIRGGELERLMGLMD